MPEVLLNGYNKKRVDGVKHQIFQVYNISTHLKQLKYNCMCQFMFHIAIHSYNYARTHTNT